MPDEKQLNIRKELLRLIVWGSTAHHGQDGMASGTWGSWEAESRQEVGKEYRILILTKVVHFFHLGSPSRPAPSWGQSVQAQKLLGHILQLNHTD